MIKILNEIKKFLYNSGEKGRIKYYMQLYHRGAYYV